jgi:uncharacterized protein (TIGR00725 family)
MSAAGFATVGVMGSGSDEHEDLAAPLGRLLGSLEVNLLTGAGRGVMTSVSRAYLKSRRGRGISIGVVPCRSLATRDLPRAGYPNAYVELPVYTHLPFSGAEGHKDLSRNHINVLTSDVIIALPGGDGTASEIELAIRYEKPIAAFAAEPGQLERFDATLARYFRIADVEAFLLRHLRRNRDENRATVQEGST